MFDHSRNAVAAAAGLVVLPCLVAPLSAAVVPADAAYVASLDGTWRFRVVQPPAPSTAPTPGSWKTPQPIETPAVSEAYQAPDFKEDDTWHDLAVPGNWEIAGYSPATYDNPDNAAGLYRKWIDVPASWAGRRVLINFDGVQNGAEVWLNGQPVPVHEPSWGRSNYHESGWTAWQADLTPHVKFGERNLLAMRVAKNTKSSDLDSGDYFFLGGIYRTVTLFSVPQTHIRDITVRTTLESGGKAKVAVLADVAGVSGKPPTLSIRVGDDGAPVEAPTNAAGAVELAQVVANPRLWSAEHPNLYPLTVELKGDDGKVIERVTRRIGIREVTIKDGVLLLNGTPVKLTGICRHDVEPDLGTAVGEELWRKDLTLMREANINAVRTSHYPYGSGFYDLCDEMGFYVVDELPYCWCNTKDLTLTPAFLQRARETIARDKNHPCVIIWAIGNENKPGENSQIVADAIKPLDPTRPRLVSCKRADQYGTEFDDSHYTAPQGILKAARDKARRAKWPQIYTENPNVWDVRLGADPGCWDRWAAVLLRTWDVVWKYDDIPGAFLWEWQDRAVADKCPKKLYEVDPATGIQYLKIKGVVDGFRHPRPEHYHLKMIYSPINVAPEADLSAMPRAVTLDVTNRYSFTDLAELKANWRLLKDGKPLASGTAQLKLAPRTRAKLELALPTSAANVTADALRIDFDHPGGWNVVSCQFAMAKEAPRASAMRTAPPEDLRFPQFNLVSNITKGDPEKWRAITRRRGSLINVKTEPAGGSDALARPLTSMRSLEADVVFADEPATVIGHLRAEWADGRLKYRLAWSGKKADIQELGWIFDRPAAFKRFSWKRKALWSVYPETHIGRPTGTATPDSANVPLTNNTRPDAFDFNSTKYDCDWASLTDAEGNGLRVEFAPDQRHHVRGGFGPDGGLQLIVNRQCSPPQDISSGVVKDFYLTLKPGDTVEGGFRVGSNQE